MRVGISPLRFSMSRTIRSMPNTTQTTQPNRHRTDSGPSRDASHAETGSRASDDPFRPERFVQARTESMLAIQRDAFHAKAEEEMASLRLWVEWISGQVERLDSNIVLLETVLQKFLNEHSANEDACQGVDRDTASFPTHWT